MPRRKSPRLRQAAYSSERNRRSASAWDQAWVPALERGRRARGNLGTSGHGSTFSGASGLRNLALLGGPPNGYGIGDQIARLALLPCAGVL
jgi:hypothetical protein